MKVKTMAWIHDIYLLNKTYRYLYLSDVRSLLSTLVTVHSTITQTYPVLHLTPPHYLLSLIFSPIFPHIIIIIITQWSLWIFQAKLAHLSPIEQCWNWCHYLSHNLKKTSGDFLVSSWNNSPDYGSLEYIPLGDCWYRCQNVMDLYYGWGD